MAECCCKNNCVNTGTIIYSHIVQPGYMKADGRLLSRCSYAHLFRFAFENQLILSEDDWANDMQGMYAEGDGVNTFRVPDLRGQFLRGADDGAGVDINRILGSKQGDAIRNITGVTQANDVKSLGAFYRAKTGTGGLAAGSQGDSVGFDASRVVPTAEENRPVNIALIAQIKY